MREEKKDHPTLNQNLKMVAWIPLVENLLAGNIVLADVANVLYKGSHTRYQLLLAIPLQCNH